MSRKFSRYGGDLFVGDVTYPLTHNQYLEVAAVLEANAKVMISGIARRRGYVDRWIASDGDWEMSEFMPDPSLPDHLTGMQIAIIRDAIDTVQRADGQVLVIISDDGGPVHIDTYGDVY